jgi:hypothetical protein
MSNQGEAPKKRIVHNPGGVMASGSTYGDMRVTCAVCRQIVPFNAATRYDRDTGPAIYVWYVCAQCSQGKPGNGTRQEGEE